MSLVNDVLKDLQTRQATVAHPLAGLQPAAAARRRVSWVGAAVGVLVVVTGLTAWRMDASVRAAAPVAVVPEAATTPGPVDRPPHARTLQLATLTDFAGSRRARPGLAVSPKAVSSRAPTIPSVGSTVSTARPATAGTARPSIDATPTTVVPVVAEPAPERPVVAVSTAVRSVVEPPKTAEYAAADNPRVAAAATDDAEATRVVVQRADAGSPAERALARAIEHQAAGDVADATEALAAAVNLDPGHTEAWRRLAAIRLGAGDVDEAVAALRRGMASADEPHELRLMLARVLVDAGRNAAALSVLNPTVASPAPYPALAALRAAVLQREGRHEEAAELYETLTVLTPGEGSLWVGLAIARESLGAPAEALTAYRRASAVVSIAPSLARYADQRVAALETRSP